MPKVFFKAFKIRTKTSLRRETERKLRNDEAKFGLLYERNVTVKFRTVRWN